MRNKSFFVTKYFTVVFKSIHCGCFFNVFMRNIYVTSNAVYAEKPHAYCYRVFVAGPQGLLYIADTVDKMINIPSLALGIRINIFLATKSWIHPGFIIFNYNNLPTTTFASGEYFSLMC